MMKLLQFAGWLPLGGMAALVITALSNPERDLRVILIWVERGDLNIVIVFGMIAGALLYWVTRQRE